MRHTISGRHFEVEAADLIREYGVTGAEMHAILIRDRLQPNMYAYWNHVVVEIRLQAKMAVM